ncbi:hypothetical protein PV341_16110 [Streptomyces sp. PA03-1a]|nr:hypothetical protein [Streptomyces sp. PA03-1a]MDX2813357.1 hypothetical protein [Streptomyces sp. PA03-5A]
MASALAVIVKHGDMSDTVRRELGDLLADIEAAEAQAGSAAVVDNCRCFDTPGHDAACHKSRVLHDGVAYSAVHWHLDSGQDWWMPYGIDDDGQLTFLADGDGWATPKPLGELIARYGPITGTEYGVEIDRGDLPETQP